MLETLDSVNLTLGPLIATFILGITTFALLVLYSIRKQALWKKSGIPFVKPYPILGCVLDSLFVPFHELEPQRYKEHGKIYGHYEGNRPLLSVGDPEIIRDILLKDFQSFTGRRPLNSGEEVMDKMLSVVRGEDWKRLRTIVTPTFSTGKIKRMLGIFKECSKTLVENFRKAAEKGEPIETKGVYGAFTMDVIASAAFSTKIDSNNDPNNEFVRFARMSFDTTINWRMIIFVLCPRILKLLGVSLFPRKGIDFFSRVTLEIIEERKKTGLKRNDFLQLLLDTVEELSEGKTLDDTEKDDTIENYGKEQADTVFKQIIFTKKSLSNSELVAQCVIFFIAGYETTASTLAFASYCLALNPEVQETLIKEIDDVLEQTNGELTYEALQSMKYLDNVISETLRMYPPALRIERLADEDYTIKKTGLFVPKGTIITIPVIAMQHDSDFYPDPEKFNPDRFTHEERAKRDQYAYLPFGAGPRNCVAMRFALTEAKVCLAYVLCHFRIKKCAQTKVPLQFKFNPGMLQANDITLQFEARNDAVKIW